MLVGVPVVSTLASLQHCTTLERKHIDENGDAGATATWRAIKTGAKLTAHAAPPSPSRRRREICGFAVAVKT